MFVEERLSKDKHFECVGDFSCGADNPLDNFLVSDAFKYDEEKYGNTYLVFTSDKKHEIVGFYTLKTSALQVKENYVSTLGQKMERQPPCRRHRGGKCGARYPDTQGP